MYVRGFGYVCMFKFDSWNRVRRGLTKWKGDGKEEGLGKDRRRKDAEVDL